MEDGEYESREEGEGEEGAEPVEDKGEKEEGEGNASESDAEKTEWETDTDDDHIEDEILLENLKQERDMLLEKKLAFESEESELAKKNLSLQKELMELSERVNEVLINKAQEQVQQQKAGRGKRAAGSGSKAASNSEGELSGNAAYAKQVEKLEKEIDARNNLLENAKKHIAEMQKQNTDMAKQLTNCANMELVQEIRDQIASKRTELDGLKKEKKQLENQIRLKDKELVHLERDIESYPDDNFGNYEKEIDALEESIGKAKVAKAADEKMIEKQKEQLEKNLEVFAAFLKQLPSLDPERAKDVDTEEKAIQTFLNLEKERAKLLKNARQKDQQIMQEQKIIEQLSKKGDQAATVLKKEVSRMSKVINNQRKNIEQQLEKLTNDVLGPSGKGLYAEEEQEEIKKYLDIIREELENSPTASNDRLVEAVKERRQREKDRADEKREKAWKDESWRDTVPPPDKRKPHQIPGYDVPKTRKPPLSDRGKNFNSPRTKRIKDQNSDAGLEEEKSSSTVASAQPE